MSHAGHGRRVCQFGVDHGRCRCPEGGERVIQVQCDTPRDHATTEELALDYRQRLEQEGAFGPSGAAANLTKAERGQIEKDLVVGLDPAYLPGLVAAEAEIERKEENERVAVWEHGFRAGTSNALEREPGEAHKKNPYQAHGPAAGQPLPSPYRFVERIQRGEFDRYLGRIVDAATDRRGKL